MSLDTWNVQAASKVVAIMRHALASGIGDPPDFGMNNRATQSNLSEPGRQQAQRIDEVLRAQSIDEASLFISAWFRY